MNSSHIEFINRAESIIGEFDKQAASELLGLDFEYISEMVKGEEWQESMDDYYQVRSCYVGTVFSLTPSGKYYMPFACSNVDACEKCEGYGCEVCGYLGSVEAYADQLFWEVAELLADEYGLVIESSEGDPCDVLVSEYRESEVIVA